MAKKQNNVEAAVQAEMENENVVVNPTDETQETEQVQVEKPVKDAKPNDNTPKLVKIHTTEVVDAIVAGNLYRFPKDRDASVPTDVAAILVNGKKAYRI